LALIASLAALAFSSVHQPWIIAGLAVLVAFFSASQDIVIDAYRTEILRPDELGAGASLYIAGYRVGLICSASLAMRLAEHHSWQVVYLIMAGGMLIGVLTTLLAPEPAVGVPAPRTIAQAVVLPLTEFLRRRGAIEMLLFILIYKLDWAMIYAMTTPFLVAAGFENKSIGDATGLGIFATISGAVIGGAAMTRVGIHRSLWIFGLLQGLAGLSFTLLALMGKNYPMMVTAIVVENVCSGMATAAFAGFIMSLCDKRFTATQFALLTSLMALCRVLAGMPAGWLAKNIGWPNYFIVATLIAIPGLLLLLRYRRWQGVMLEAKSEAA
jgi:PAT family beta-lactamase induction signal transducer AmpG